MLLSRRAAQLRPGALLEHAAILQEARCLFACFSARHVLSAAQQAPCRLPGRRPVPWDSPHEMMLPSLHRCCRLLAHLFVLGHPSQGLAERARGAQRLYHTHFYHAHFLLEG